VSRVEEPETERVMSELAPAEREEREAEPVTESVDRVDC
jgi:hypothetical protein